MGLFNKGGAVADVIRCDEPDYLVWKWHPAGSESGNNKRENAIRWGSSLRVKDGAVAVFVYKQKNGVMQDFVEGPFDEFLSTKNLPIISSILGVGYDGNSPFQAEVYFINMAKIIQSKFAVPYFDVYDPRFLDFGVPVAVRGTITYRIKDYREFIKLHKLEGFTIEDFVKQVKDAVSKYTKDVVTNIPKKNGTSVIQLEQQIGQINDVMQSNIQDRFSNEFGVLVSSVDVATVDIDKSSDGYAQLKAVTQDILYATTKARAEAEIKNIHDLQRVNMENYQETLRIQREEGAYAQHKQTQTANLGAFQTEKQAEVGVAGANALGQMGANGAGTINLGESGGMGFNPAAMMAGIALGGAVGQNMAGTINNMMSGMSGVGQAGVQTPPPIKNPGYNVAVNGVAMGPFDLNILAQMVLAGQLLRSSMVWKAGMADWSKAESVEEIKGLFDNREPQKDASDEMPPIPQ